MLPVRLRPRRLGGHYGVLADWRGPQRFPEGRSSWSGQPKTTTTLSALTCTGSGPGAFRRGRYPDRAGLVTTWFTGRWPTAGVPVRHPIIDPQRNANGRR
jgi:hypothetical protein